MPLQKGSQGDALLLFRLGRLDLFAPFKDPSPTELCFAGESILAPARKEAAISNRKANIKSLSAPVSLKMHHVWISGHLVD